MKDLLLREILAPLSRRLGIMATSYLSGVGLSYDVTAPVEALALVAGGIAFDLILSHKSRKAR